MDKDLLENVTIPVEVTGAYKKYLNSIVEKEGVSLNFLHHQFHNSCPLF